MFLDPKSAISFVTETYDITVRYSFLALIGIAQASTGAALAAVVTDMEVARQIPNNHVIHMIA
jgi:hypothetical protein